MNWHTREVVEFNAQTPLLLRKNKIGDFHLYHISPVLEGNIVLLGELDKIVPLSEQRFGNIEISGGNLQLYLNGVVGE